MEREQAMKPRVLVVEDDAVSRAFFVEVLSGLPLAVEAVGRCDDALARAAAHAHALWLVDARLPDGAAVSLLPKLRALDAGAVALAHTASPDQALRAALLAAGYVDVLVKPFAAGRLLEAVGRRLRLPVREPRPAFTPAVRHSAAGRSSADPCGWDDDDALCALDGNPASVVALRTLFAAELPAAVRTVEAAVAAGDTVAARAALHRLVPACALTGAGVVGDAARRLHAAPMDGKALAAFRSAVDALPPL